MKSEAGRKSELMREGMRRPHLMSSAHWLGALIVIFCVILSEECLAGSWTWNHQSAVNYANTWVSGYNPSYANYAPNDCANFVSQCLIAGGLDLSTGVHDAYGCIISCTSLDAYLVNSPAVSQHTTLPKGTAEPLWYVPGDVAIFRNSSGTCMHTVMAVTGDATHYSTNAGHQQPNGIYTIAAYFSANPTWTQCSYYHLVDSSAASPPAAFTKQSPPNDGTPVTSQNVTLSWNPSSGGNITYNVTLNTDNNVLIHSWSGVTATSVSYTLPNTYGADYYWQVTAVNSAGTTDADGGTWWWFWAKLLDDLTISKTSLTLPTTTQGTAGGTATFSVSGVGLSSVDYLTLTAPSGCEISLNGFSFANTCQLYPDANGSISTTTVYARINAWATANVNGSLTIQGHSKTSLLKTIQVSGTVTPQSLPTITSVNPSPVVGANSAQTITINGANFVNKPALTLTWPGQTGYLLPPAYVTYVNNNQLQMSIVTGTDPSTWTVKATNPDNQPSNVKSFQVNAPVPVITSISPTSAGAGSGAITLTVNGTTFQDASIVKANGNSLATTEHDSPGGFTTYLTATLPSSYLASAGTVTITVYSPGPGGGTSAGASFTVNGTQTPILSVTPADPQTVPAAGRFITYTVSNTGGGTMSYSASLISGFPWLQIISGQTGGNSGTILVSCAQNTDAQRSGTIQVTASGASGSPVTITIIQAPATSAAMIVGYFQDGDRYNDCIEYDMLTQVNYTFLYAYNDGTLDTSKINFSTLGLVVKAAHNAGAHISISVQCYDSPVFHNIANSPAALATFCNALVQFCAQQSLDGIDLDWEAFNDVANDTPNATDYGIIIDALRGHMASSALLSVAVHPIYHQISLQSVSELDWVAVMDYDLQLGDHANYNLSVKFLNGWATYGVPKAKLLMGVPFYGRDTLTWTDTLSYGTIVNDTYPALNTNQIYDPNPIYAGTWFYNGITTIQSKIQFVLNNGFGGMMIWALGQDHCNTQGKYDQWSLLPAIFNVANSSLLTHTVMPAAGDNGNISPNMPQFVPTLGSVIFTASPATGSTAAKSPVPMDETTSYVVDEWLVNGIPAQTGGTNFTLLNVTADTAVEVTFKPAPVSYTVTPSAAANGSISPNSAQSVASGDSITFTGLPDPGYVAEQWQTNNVAAQSGGTSFTLANVTADTAVQVTFVAVPAATDTVTASPVPAYGGTVCGGGAFTDGSQQTVTATANPGYSFINWTENGIEVSSSTNYAFTLTTNRALVANFTATQFILSDKDSPALLITQPYSSGVFLTTTNAVTLAGTASDLGHGDNGISIVTVNGVEATGDTTANGGTANWSLPVSLNLGTNVFTVVAKDSCNNSSQQQITVTYTPTPASASIISLSGDLAFGAAAVGSELDNFLTIHNSGTGTLHVTNVICPDGFTGSWSGSIAAGSSTDVLIAFQPTLPASYRGAIVVSSDAGSGTNTIAVSGTGTSTEPHNPNIAIAVKIQPGNALVMTWPTNAVGFQLEFATNLLPSAIWSPVGTAATIVNGQYVLTNSATGHAIFFRLHQQ
jgi:chitinase